MRIAGLGIGTSARGLWWLVVMAAAIYACAGLGSHPLLAPDEIRVAEIAREMASTKELLVPRLAGAPFLEQPPLYYAAVAAAFRLLGVSDGVARLPSALATLGLLLLAFDLGRRMGGTRAGLLAAAVLAATSGVLRYGHDCTVDALLALCVMAGYWAYARLLLEESPPGRRSPSSTLVLAVYASATLAFLVKGPVGPAFVILPVLVHALITRRWSLLLARVHLLAVPLFLAALACWPVLLRLRAGPASLSEWWEQGAIGRFTTDGDYKGGHTGEGALYYLSSFPTLALPWSLALPFVVRWLWKGRPLDGDPRKLAVHRVHGFFAAACLLGVLLLSAAGSKRAIYALPLLAPLAVLTAAWIAAVASRLHRGLERAAWLLFGVSLVALSIGGVFGDPERDFTPMARDLDSMQALGNTVGFESSETVRAIVPFRTGIILANLKDADTLELLRGERSALNVLTEGPDLPAALEPLACRLQRVRQWNFGRHEISLYALAPP